MSSWWKRFFGLEDETDELRPPSKQKTSNSDEVNKVRTVHEPNQKVGRFADPHRDVEIKIVNQYASTQGPMRKKELPASQWSSKVDRLGSKTKEKKTSFESPSFKRVSKSEWKDSAESAKPKGPSQSPPVQPTKRTRFVATSVPSPIYGFRGRPTSATHPNPTLETETPSHSRPLTSEKIRSTPPQQARNGTQSPNVLNPSTFPTPEAVSPVVVGQPASDSTIDAGTEKNNQDISLVGRPDKQGDFSPKIEALNDESSVDDLTHDYQDEKEPFKNVEAGSTPKLSLNKRREAVPNTQRFKEQEPQKRTTVPYNVMMLETDRLFAENSRKSKSIDPLSLNLLNDPRPLSNENDQLWIEDKKQLLGESLQNFNVKADVLDYIQGPTVTRFEIRLHPGVKVNKVISLTEDLKLTLSAKQIRIAPISGKNTVGIEIPNPSRKPVHLKSLLQSKAYQNATSPLTAVLGQDISGNHIVTDLAKMPHGLIAGATGSGKSVCIHSLILSLIYKATPDELRFILIDPKVVELATYRDMPHLAAPVITQTREASLALKWAVDEMEERYQRFAETGVRDLSRYNDLVKTGKIKGEKLPYIVIVIDELADLMMTSPQEVEAAICRIAQKARAAGIHMLLATQRPSVDVITGLIKSNIPTRIAFSVSSQVDSRTILDMSGAERLLGQGDLLFSENGSRSLLRLQGTFVTDEEIERITETFHQQDHPAYLFDASDLQETSNSWDQEEDELFEEVGQFVIEQGQASVSSLQRRFRIGYNRAARLVDQLEAASVVTESNGSKPRQVLMDKQTFEQDVLNFEKIKE